MTERETEPQGSGDMTSTSLGDRLFRELGLRKARRLMSPGIELPPVMLDRYEILAGVGEGGMNLVFEARDPLLGRRVAIKACKANSREAAQLIVHEARSLAQLAHPNIVAVFDVVCEGSDVALVLEFIEGETLRAWQRRTAPPWPEVLACYVQAGEALAAVHAAGLEHADFKPDNVLIDAEGRVRVIDFGLGLHSSPTPGEQGELTNVGTREYMAPERLMDRPGGGRADVYSFCVSVWEALYGVRPYGAPEQRNAAALLDAIERGKPRRGKVPEGLPMHVRDVLLVGLAADPNERHASMADVLRALLDVLRADEPRVDRRDEPRGRWRWAAAGLLVVVTIGGGAYLLTRDFERSPVEQTLELANVEASENNATGTVQFLELARMQARRSGDADALRLVASEASSSLEVRA